MKKLIFATLISLLLVSTTEMPANAEDSGVLKQNDHLEAYTLEDQHEISHTLQKDTEKVIVSFDMKLSKKFHQWLKEKDDSYLADRKTEYIIDIRGMPSIITWLFAGPKMRKYGFQILLIKEGDLGDKLPKQEGEFTVIELDSNHKATNISFLNNIDAITKSIE